MIDSIDEKLRQAQITKDKDDVNGHPGRVKKAAISYMKANSVTETPEIKANGYKVVFSNPQDLKMMVDGKEFSGKELDAEINRIDMIGADMKKGRDKKRIQGIAKKEVKNIGSVAKVSAIRAAVSAPVRMAESGHRTAGALLRGLWSLLQRAMQR